MSAVSEGPASEELDPFDLSKMTAREVAAELARRSQPKPIDTAPRGTSASDGASAGEEASASPAAAPLPAFLSAPLSLSSDEASARATPESGGRDPLDTLSRALHNHLQERAASEDDAAKFASVATSPTTQKPTSSSPTGSWKPAMAAETWPPSAAASAAPRSSGSLDIPAAPSSIDRTPENDLPLGLLLGGFARGSMVPDRPMGTGRPVGTGPLLAGRSVTTERLQRAAAADSLTADSVTTDSVAAERSAPDLADSNIPLIPSRPAIRRFRSEDRLLERAKAIVSRRTAALSARLSSRASAGASAAAVQWRRVPQWRQMPGSNITWRNITWRSINWRPAQWHSANWHSANWRPTNWRRINWRSVHWEAVASGVLIGILLTIAPAIYLLTAPHHASAPAASEQAAVATPDAAATPSPAPDASTATPPVPAVPTTTADSSAAPPTNLAPPPPAIMPPDPPSLVTAAGGTTANAETATSPATGSEQVAAIPGKDASTTMPPATKPATVKSTSSKKLKPKAGTVSAHQTAHLAADQLSPAKR